MLKIKVHPVFILYAIVLVIENKFIYLLSSLVCIALHEWAHAKVAYNLGYYLDTLNIMPYGAMVLGKNEFCEKDGCKISFAGPLSNICLCIVILACWWLFPETYKFTKVLYSASLSLAFFNLLPVFPLDGARIILSITNNNSKTLLLLKGLGYALCGLFTLAFLTSFFYTPNLNLGIIGATLYLSTSSSCKKEEYKKICSTCSFIKKLDAPIKKRTLMIHQDIKLIRLLRHINAETETTFEIVDDALNVIKILSEYQIKELASTKKLHTPIREFLRP